mgnify:CR=1 FL=1
MEKLLKNLDKMVWKRIKRWSEEKLENELEIRIPEEDRKYLKVFQGGRAMNIIFKIENRNFYVECNVLDTKFANMLTDNYFKENKKIVTLINFNVFIKDGIEGNLVAYDFTKNSLDPEIVYTSYIQKQEEYGKYKVLKESIKEVKIGKRVKDLFKYMYITDKKQEDAEVGIFLKFNSTDEEIEEFEDEIE